MKFFTPPKNGFKSIQSLFLVAIGLLVLVMSLPLFFAGVTIINDITRTFGREILTAELQSLIEPISLRYKTLQRVGLEDSLPHQQEIREQGLRSLETFTFKESGFAFVVSRAGEILVSEDFTAPGDAGFSSFLKRLTDEPTSVEYENITGAQIAVASYYAPWDAYIGISLSRDELFAPRDFFVRLNLMVLGVVFLIALGFAWGFQHYIIAPVLRIARFAEAVTKGDLQQEVPGNFILELATVKNDVEKMVASLISREEKYKAVFDAPSDVIFIHDAQTGSFLGVNKAVYEVYGYTPEEIMDGMTIGDLSSGIHPYTLEEAGRIVAKVTEGTPQRMEWQARRKSGRLVWLDVSLRSFNYDGEECVLAVCRDIDAQKRFAEQVAAEKEQLAITLRSIGDGVITTDRQGDIVLINRVAEKLTGWGQSEAVGRPLEDVLQIYNGKTNQPCDNPAFAVLQSGLRVEIGDDAILVARDGSRLNIADSAAPIFDPESQIVGVVLVFRDVTERYHLEQEMLKVKKLESVGVLAGGIAHDFNNLLAAIQGNIDLARLQLGHDSDAARFLVEAEKASLRAKHLTQQLLTFSKGGDPVCETTDLVEIIEDNSSFVLSGSVVSSVLHADDDLWAVDIDPGQIGQVIQNIIINSRQAMLEDGGCITISAQNCLNCSDLDRCVHLKIKDDGPGIDPEVIDKIFDPYFTTKEEGSGLGLAICHSIIQKHNGVLRVESQLGQGTEFLIKLPVAEKNVVSIMPRPERLVDQGHLKILIMDDESMIQHLAVEMCRALEHQSAIADDGLEALQLYEEALSTGHPFDVVIMDLTIPGGMGGEEAVGELLRFDPLAKVVVSSGYSNDPVMSNYKEYGFCGKLMKPFSLQELKKVFAEVVGDRSAGFLE